MTQNPIRLVIFDFDGTLADASGLIIAMQATLKYMQLPVPTAEQVKRVIGLPLIDCFTHLVPMDDATAQKCSEAYRNIFEEKKNKEILPQPFPNVDATLRKLHADGYTLAIASSRLTYSLMSFIDAFQWTSLISEVIGPDKGRKIQARPRTGEQNSQRPSLPAAGGFGGGRCALRHSDGKRCWSPHLRCHLRQRLARVARSDPARLDHRRLWKNHPDIGAKLRRF